MMETGLEFLILSQNAVNAVLNIVAESQWTELLEVLKLGGRYAVDPP